MYTQFPLGRILATRISLIDGKKFWPRKTQTSHIFHLSGSKPAFVILAYLCHLEWASIWVGGCGRRISALPYHYRLHVTTEDTTYEYFVEDETGHPLLMALPRLAGTSISTMRVTLWGIQWPSRSLLEVCHQKRHTHTHRSLSFVHFSDYLSALILLQSQPAFLPLVLYLLEWLFSLLRQN